jgi:glyoxylase-like metal-dependent hydrolase (beta-lactamase superfamily II)
MPPAIHTIDLHHLGTPGAIAAYVVRGTSGAVLIETGPANTVAALERGLCRLGLKPADIGHVLVTHIHLDHAGAAGWMARHGATIHVHEFGAPHLVDPARLLHSAGRIYGPRLEHLWGRMLPVPAEQIHPLRDGDVLDVAGLRLRALETPGHARHHHAFVLEDCGAAFTGDAAATFIAGCEPFISLPTPPPEFDLELWLASLRRLEAERLAVAYPTHFGAVREVGTHLRRVRECLQQHVATAARLLDAGPDHDAARLAYSAWFTSQARAAGVSAQLMRFYVTDALAAMNLSGMARYLERERAVAR